MAQSNNLNPNDYLTEDPMVLPFGKWLRYCEAKFHYLCVVLAAILKITKLLGGRLRLNAGARESHPVEYPQIQVSGRRHSNRLIRSLSILISWPSPNETSLECVRTILHLRSIEDKSVWPSANGNST